MTNKIAVLVGSLRKQSLNRKMALFLKEIAPTTLQLDIIEIGQLPLYNQDGDDEGNPPSAWLDFRQKIKNYDGVLFITPEYNRSVSAVLKNAVDVGSRPYGQSIWEGKPGAIMSVSPGAIGGFGANHHLRQSLVCLNVPTLQQPEAYIGNAGKMFNEQGKITDEKTQAFLRTFMEQFAHWVEVNKQR